MKEKALGVIETIGLVPAIEAADTGLKTADVTLDGMEMVGAGLVAIILRGDVSSVKAAVEAGAHAAARLGQVFSTTVIARTAEGLESVILTGNGNPQESAVTLSASSSAHQAAAVREHPAEMPDIERLGTMSVVKLRAYVRTLPHYPMAREEIRSARKQDLLVKIEEYFRERGLSND
jgi:microcompartment protein CcmL/EutN